MSPNDSGKPGSVEAPPATDAPASEAAPPGEAATPEIKAEETPKAAEDEDGDEDGDEELDDSPLDLESRILCPDGSCIGVIGADGRCKECGTALPEKERAAVAAILARSAVEEQAEEKVEAKVPSASPVADASDGDEPDFSKRVLCSDGSCIGVIGLDGQCKECGKPYRGEPTD